MSNDLQILTNLKTLEFVATKLKELCNELVFLGGCTTGLFITDKATPDVRYTLDVDCIVDVISLSEYYRLEKKLLNCGFKKSKHDNITCRWHYDDVILDVMPTDEKILGFSNYWYKEAILNAIAYALTMDLNINIVTAPYFLATKLEAFRERGKMDFYASHDFEDIVSIIDGRLEINKEIQRSDEKLKNYLIAFFSRINMSRSFHDALPGHFIHYGNLANDRIQLFLNKIEEIIQT